MFSIPHLIIVFVVALVVFGPEKLPELARNLGKIMGEFKKATGDLRSTFEGHLKDLEREADQRRMTQESATAATATSVLGIPAVPPIPAEPGTIATTPPHISGASEPSASETPSSDSVDPTKDHWPQNGEAPAASTVEHASALQPEHNPETLTDAGLPPA